MPRRLFAYATCVAATAGLVSGCSLFGGDDQPEEVVVTVTSTRSSAAGTAESPAPVTVTTTVKKDGGSHSRDTAPDGRADAPLAEVYRAILANPRLVPFTNPSDRPINPTGDYRYTLADVDGDGKPDMMLNIAMEETGPGWPTVGYVTFVLSRSTPGNIVVAKGVTLDGAASAGGFRAGTLMPTGGQTGIAEAFWQSVGTETTNNIYSVDGDGVVVKERDYTDTIDTSGPWTLPTPGGYCLPAWHSVADTSLVDSMTTGGCEN
ncbi:hypothetical protein ACFSSC_09005 [Corynebacterium mendelii]|uniref:Lipoprotein n=1 Tax=Corynebacterium mendelii TaxID=2765362 RepID=A0A939E192_9CORY|nr:hypothetical protein [Corynebacterium mendelii]MBN9645114.1 hypothetical protein [Corynebacterium mendelii]